MCKPGEDVLIRNTIGGDFGSDLLRLNDERNGTGGSEKGGNGWGVVSMFTPGSSLH